MLGKLFPVEHVKSIEDVDYDRLLKSGFENFFFDYDFTLAPWGELQIKEDVEEIFRYLLDNGARVFIVTNAKKSRVDHLKEKIPELVVYWSVGKPSIKKFREIIKEWNIDAGKSVIIGDLFLTDVLAGNRLGMYTIMVQPLLWETMRIYKKVMAFLSMLLYGTFFFTVGWIFRMGSLMSPNEWRKSVKDINFDKLVNSGFKAFIFDFDNTLAPWRSSHILEENRKILKKLKDKAAVLIASNGKPREIDIDVEVIWRSRKPIARKVKRKLREMGIDTKRVVVIGDQLLTDVLFGNLIGAYTIKVDPIKKEEAPITKMNRLIEKIFSKLIVNKPSITKERNGEK